MTQTQQAEESGWDPGNQDITATWRRIGATTETVGELRRLWLERRRFGEGSVGPGFSRQAPGNGAGWFEVRGPSPGHPGRPLQV